MDIRCVNCNRLLAKVEEDTEVIGAITIKCSSCNFLNVISGILKVIEKLDK